MAVIRISLSALQEALDRGRLILVPNHLTANAILQSWAAQQRSASWLRPRVIPIDIWLRELWEGLASRGIEPFARCRLLQTRQEKLIWNRIIESDPDAPPLLNNAATAQLASQAHQLCRQWLVTPSSQKLLAEGAVIPDVARFLHWQKSFAGFCSSHDVRSLADAIPDIIQALEKGQVTRESQPLLVNFLEPPPLYARLFDLLKESWQASDVSTWGPLEESGATGPARLHRFNQQADEIDACAHWVCGILRQHPHAHIGLISSDIAAVAELMEDALRKRLDPLSMARLDNRPALVNVYKSHQPLARESLIDHGLQLLSLNFPEQQTLELCRLLQSPYVAAAPQQQAACARLEEKLRRRAQSRIRLADVRQWLSDSRSTSHAPELAQRLLQFEQLARHHRERKLARHWADLFDAQLGLMGWPGSLVHDRERQALQLWQAALDTLRQSSDWMGHLTLFQALGKLRELLAEEALSPAIDLSCQVSLLSPAEASGLRFDHLWILDMDDRHWPQRSHPHPLLPFLLQRETGMPGTDTDRDYRQSQALLTGLQLATVDNMILSHITTDGDRKLRSASLLKTLAPEIAQNGELSPALPDALPRPELEIVPDVMILPLLPEETPRGGARLLSNQVLCPFRAYAEHRLRCQPLEQPVSGLPAAARGKAVHLALERFYEQVPDHEALCNLPPEALDDLVSRACHEAIDWLKHEYRQTMTPRFSNIELQRLVRLLRDFLTLEKTRPPFRIQATEQSVSFTAGDLALSLKIDRVDKLEDGSLLLIDYKTGSQISNQLLSDTRPDDLQLALYYTASAAGTSAPVNGAIIAQLRNGSLGYKGVAAENSAGKWLTTPRNSPSWSALTAVWPGIIVNTASAFVQGEIEVAPLRGNATCKFCGRQSLCRISSSLVEDAVEDDES